MLSALQIRDFAIIDHLELELHQGLTALTGETGAGKSILVDALQLLAGGRAAPEMIRHGAERAEICGTFELADATEALTRWLEDQALSGEELIVRRVLSADGRSRAWLNGQAVPVQLLREAGNLLIDIHGQHEFQSLTRPTCQRELLDQYGKLEPALAEVGAAYRQWHERRSRALELETAARDREARLALLRYQVGELEALTLQAGEVERLCEERSRLMNRGRLASAAQTALMQLYQDEQANAHLGVSRALQALRTAAGLDAQLAPVAALAEEAEVRIREAARELERYGESLELDTARQDELESRLAAIEELARKHRVSPSELIGRTAELSTELASLEQADVDLAKLRQELSAALERYRQQAGSLSTARRAAAGSLAEAITTHMQSLGMPGGRFEVELAAGSGEPAPHGGDEVRLQVSANPGQPVRALSRVASGGELSRLSLAVQVASSARETRCMVFDEVDSGIGGAVAEIVGRELRSLGRRGQVLCVTHLPQVASQAHHHLRVTKLTGRTTRTTLSELSGQERVEELARMLGGIDVTSKAREHAREMLEGVASAPTARRAANAPGRRGARKSPRAAPEDAKRRPRRG